MANVTMDEIKKLREETGAGVMDAKRALEEANGDVKKAKAWIQVKGLERAEKKAERETVAGQVFSYVHHTGKVGALLHLKCETDFVARTEDFQHLGKELVMQVASMSPETTEEFLAQDYLRDPGKTIADLIKGVSGKVGENIQVDKFYRI